MEKLLQLEEPDQKQVDTVSINAVDHFGIYTARSELNMLSSSKKIALDTGANKGARSSFRTVIGGPADLAWSLAPYATPGQRKGASS
jgi:hypothetical protein